MIKATADLATAGLTGHVTAALNALGQPPFDMSAETDSITGVMNEGDHWLA